MCEFCGNDKDIIFPFQLSKCQRCEGEPSLLAAGLGGSRAPSPRLSVPLTWKDWKIPKPRRLQRALCQGRKDGEGGEGLGLEVDQGVSSGEQKEPRENAEERQEQGGIFQTLNPGKLFKALSRSKGNKEEQEMSGWTESEREEGKEYDKGGEERGKDLCEEVCSEERAKSRERGDGHARREKVSLLKALHIDRLKKRTSKRDGMDSDSETCSSTESLDEVGTGQERKGRWKMSGLMGLTKGFSKRESEDERKTEVKVEERNEESEKRLLDEEGGTEEEGRAGNEAEEDDEMPDKGKKEAAKTVESSAEKVEKFTLMKQLKSHQLSAIFSRERSRREEDKSQESDGKSELDAEEEGKEVTANKTKANWRGRRTRKARRVTRGRKTKDGAEKESKEEGGVKNEMIDCAERDGGQEEKQ